MDLRQKLQKDLESSDSQMRELVLTLSEAQRNVPFHPGINPPVWEMGHSAFFFEFFLLRALYKSEPRMPGLDEMWDSFEIPHKERWRPGIVPPLDTTLDYYSRVIDECRTRLTKPEELSPREAYLFQYVIAHQNMHIESLLWCRQTLGYPAPSFVSFWNNTSSNSGTSEDITIPGGNYLIGHSKQESDEERASRFCFDNEKPGFEISLESFQISQTLVSNREFLSFVEDGGYERPGFWSLGGKYWLRESGATAPEYWRNDEGRWNVRRFDQWEPLSLDAPVLHISFREADAYCRWAGRRLPTEFEWEVAAGRNMPPLNTCDLDGRFCGTAPVNELAETSSKSGCLQMIGTAWEWTSSQYLPFAGFEVDMYAYMSTLQFGNHQTTKGGSWASSSSLIRPTYRQAYFPNRRDVFVGFRTCAID